MHREEGSRGHSDASPIADAIFFISVFELMNVSLLLALSILSGAFSGSGDY